MIPNQKKEHTFIDPIEKKFGIHDIYKLKWICISEILYGMLWVANHCFNFEPVTTNGVFDTVFENIPPVFRVGISLIIVAAISPLIEFEWRLFCKLVGGKKL